MERERLKFSIGRYDQYYESVNNKCNVFLTLSIFIFGALGGVYPTLLKNVNCNVYVHTLMTLLMFISILIMIILITASTPYLTVETNSLLYFNSVSSMKKEDFFRLSRNRKKKAELNDLRNQVYMLSKGLSKKFKKLKVAGFLFALQFILFIPLTILIISNLKDYGTL